MNHIKLTRDALDVRKISDIASAESCGALSMFVGMTRNSFGGKEVLSLEYEAYEPMAFNQLELICGDIRRRWTDIVNIAIYHRLGLVAIREASVVIAISSPHRETSLCAVSFAIDELKKRVPIWKKEIYKEDEAVWKSNKESGVGNSGKINLFNDSLYCIQDSLMLPSCFIQISASENEINRRIQCFIEKKRVEINLCNDIDFTGVNRKYNPLKASLMIEDKNNDGNEAMTCARINSIVVKQEYSKCHLKVRRAENNIGPQTRPNYLNTLDKLMVSIEREDSEPHYNMIKKEDNQTLSSSAESNMLKYPAILERLENIEEFLSVPQSKINIYQRLKVIEDRLLSLESISPEYIHFLVEQSQSQSPTDAFEPVRKTTEFLIHKRKPYSVSEINTTIQSLEKGKL